jgi:hypothetical protein
MIKKTTIGFICFIFLVIFSLGCMVYFHLIFINNASLNQSVGNISADNTSRSQSVGDISAGNTSLNQSVGNISAGNTSSVIRLCATNASFGFRFVGNATTLTYYFIGNNTPVELIDCEPPVRYGISPPENITDFVTP